MALRSLSLCAGIGGIDLGLERLGSGEGDHVNGVVFSRAWAMPSSETFSIKPIGSFVLKYLAKSRVSVDPFARNRCWATHTNDIDPATSASEHMDAESFLLKLRASSVVADLAIFDPPYSPRQISECYRSIGAKSSSKETQSGLLYRRVRDAISTIVPLGGVVLSFGWNSVGMGKERGFKLEEILLCCHGGAHNDTICIAERRASMQHEAYFD